VTTASEHEKQNADDPPSTTQFGAAIPIQIQRALEQLRQERETFDQRKRQDARWFMLRMTMGGLAVIIIPTFIIICTLLISSSGVSDTVKSLAASALLVDILGLVISVWKVVLNPASITQLSPVTTLKSDLPDQEDPKSKT
jgi:hypothetical protein